MKSLIRGCERLLAKVFAPLDLPVGGCETISLQQPRNTRGRAGSDKRALRLLRASSVDSRIKLAVRNAARQDDLQPKARAAQEAKLAKLKAEFEAHKREENERKMALRYHKVSTDAVSSLPSGHDGCLETLLQAPCIPTFLREPLSSTRGLHYTEFPSPPAPLPA